MKTVGPVQNFSNEGREECTVEPAYNRAGGSDIFCILYKKFTTKEVLVLKPVQNPLLLRILRIENREFYMNYLLPFV